MRDGVSCELQVAACEMSNSADMVCPVNKLADLTSQLVSAILFGDNDLSTLTTVRSQFDSILLDKFIKASGTIHSFTEGGLG